jgi:DNA-binding PadR family transcriptional regulator
MTNETDQKRIMKYLPLTETTYYIMLALVEPMHGYAVMQKVAEITEGKVEVGPGTLYGVFSNLEKEKLIIKVSEEERRKIYSLTPSGMEVLRQQLTRYQQMTKLGSQRIDQDK